MSSERGQMTPQEFVEALALVGWKQADFIRKTGIDKNTPSRWVTGVNQVPGWVPAYLGAMAEIKRLHETFVQT